MASLKYYGKPVTADADIVYHDYVTSVKAADLSAADVDTAINSSLSAYASVSYVDTKDGLLATQSYIDSQDNLRLRLSQKNVANGVAGLNASGKINPSFINAASSQKFNRGPWSPSNYSSDAAFTSEQTLFTCGVTDPGFPYKLVIWGSIDTHSGIDSEYPMIVVRAGNETTGDIVAQGYGPSDGNDFLQMGDDFHRADTNGADGNIGPQWKTIYTNITGNTGSLGIFSNRAAWYDGSPSERSVKCQNIDPQNKYTGSNFQKLILGISDFLGEDQAEPNQNLRIYGRVNDAFTSYVCWEQGFSSCRFLYAVNGVETQLGQAFPNSLTANTNHAMIAGDPANPRRFQLFKGDAFITQVEDTAAVTVMGPNNRGWGFGMKAAGRGFGQATPPSINFAVANDSFLAYEPTIINPTSVSARTGPTTLYIRGVRSGSSSTQRYSTYRPKLHVMAVQA